MKRLLLLILLFSTHSYAEGPFGKTFVQCFMESSFMGFSTKEGCWREGMASSHFVNESLVFINWKEMGMSYLDGEAARTSPFENTNFDLSTRTFSGSLIFDKELNQDELRWDYVMIFDENFSIISEGYIKIFFKDGTEETVPYNHRNPSAGDRKYDWWYVLAE